MNIFKNLEDWYKFHIPDYIKYTDTKHNMNIIHERFLMNLDYCFINDDIH